MLFLCERELARLTPATQASPTDLVLLQVSYTHTHAQCTTLVLLQVSYPHTIHPHTHMGACTGELTRIHTRTRLQGLKG